MNRIVHRDSDAMRSFSRVSENIAQEFEAVSNHLSGLLYDAVDNMQDESGQEAIALLKGLLHELDTEIKKIKFVSQQIYKSAVRLEETNELL